MNNKRTITTREQIKINGEIRERTATHIVTGAHGYETLCISGYIVEHNEMGEVIHNSEKLAEDLLPVTCPTCRVIWYHTHEFTLDDFDSLSGKGDFVGKRAARTVLTGMCYSVGSATRQGSSSLTRFIGQSAITSSTWRR